MTRLYINLTNYCNANCEFCCMWSNSNKNTFIDIKKFFDIVGNCEDDFELQLEGGEPLTHPHFMDFVELSAAMKKCKKIIILTNGFFLDNYIGALDGISKAYKTPILIKVSINYWLCKIDNDCLNKARILINKTKDMNLDVLFNVRLRKNDLDADLLSKIYELGLDIYSNIFYLQSYGMLEDDVDYDKPIIVQNIDNWRIYACDGTCFEQDLIARSKYELYIP